MNPVYAGLMREALLARENAYTPYSGFAVGAALLGKSGAIYRGCNVENASYTPTNCAERTAFFSAVCAGEREFSALALAGGPAGQPPSAVCFPCGVCRQVMAEFCGPDFPVIVGCSPEAFEVHAFSSLLPHPFGPSDLG